MNQWVWDGGNYSLEPSLLMKSPQIGQFLKPSVRYYRIHAIFFSDAMYKELQCFTNGNYTPNKTMSYFMTINDLTQVGWHGYRPIQADSFVRGLNQVGRTTGIKPEELLEWNCYLIGHFSARLDPSCFDRLAINHFSTWSKSAIRRELRVFLTV